MTSAKLNALPPIHLTDKHCLPQLISGYSQVIEGAEVVKEILNRVLLV